MAQAEIDAINDFKTKARDRSASKLRRIRDRGYRVTNTEEQTALASKLEA
jgi:hypothetical protein